MSAYRLKINYLILIFFLLPASLYGRENQRDRLPVFNWQCIFDFESKTWKEYSRMEVCFNAYLMDVEEYLKAEILLMPEIERDKVVETLNEELQFIIDICITHYHKHPPFTKIVYNAVLLVKGLFTNFSRKIDMEIALYDEKVGYSWNELKRFKRWEETLKQYLEYLNAVENIMLSSDTLSVLFNKGMEGNEVLQEEYLRIKSSIDDGWIYESEKNFLEWIDLDSEILSDIFINMDSLLNILTPEEAAIEIATCRESISEEGVYKKRFFALILYPGLTIPYLIKLPDNMNGNVLFNNEGYTPEEIYSVLWAPVLEKIPANIQTLYVAQSSNVLPVCGVRKGGGFAIEEEFRIHTLLSTKDILRLKNKDSYQSFPESANALLIGGVDYWFTSEITEDSIKNNMLQIRKDTLLPDSSFRGQGFDYLPGSAREVSAIAAIMKSYGWNVTLLEDDRATEKQIYTSLSELTPQIIHISTHGFYFPESSPVEDLSTLNRYSSVEFAAKKSRNPLLRAGIVCSGGNWAWNKIARNRGFDEGDGLITAMEISRLNLIGTELVVLSACESGIGQQKDNETTYGLVHALRLAGADTMIVTLCKIPDDDEIVNFMKIFYTEWLSGINIRDAFATAQNFMKEKYPGEPQKWAAFLLIE